MPYRDQGTTCALSRSGVCPWCRQTVSFDASQVSTVCERCGARYATALAIPQEPASILPRRSRVLYISMVVGAVLGGVVLLSFVTVGEALALIIMLALAPYLAVLKSSRSDPPELPSAREPDDSVIACDMKPSRRSTNTTQP